MDKKPGLVILAGGRSRRMGRDKAELMLDTEKQITFLERMCDEMSFFEEKLISVNKDQAANAFYRKFEKLGFKLVVDEVPESGSIGGIYSALKAATSEALFVIACDMPFFMKETAEYIIDRWQNEDVCIYRTDRPQPLTGIYRKSCVPVFREQILNKDYKILLAYDKVSVKYVDMPMDDEIFVNVNTMEEYVGLNR